MSGSPQFEDVFVEHADYVIRSLERLGVRSRDLEDVAQEVFLAVHDRLSTYDPARPIKPWLFAFAFRSAGNYTRLARNSREDVQGTELVSLNDEPASGTPEEELLRAEQRARLHRALGALDLEHRAALSLIDIDGIEPRDAAEALGIPINTLYSRVRNGRIKLRAALEAMAAQEGGRR